MSHDQPREHPAAPLTMSERGRLAGPRLELPRFQFSPSSSLARPGAADATSAAGAAAPRAATAPAPTSTPYAPAATTPLLAPAVRSDLRPAHLASPRDPFGLQTAAAPQQQHAVAYAAPAPACAVSTHRLPVPMRPVATPSPSPFASATSGTPVAWQGGEAVAPRTLVQRISPVHMGVLLVMVMVAMVVTSGPASMTAKPARLPALASGGGSAIGADGMPIRAGSTAIAATAPATAPAAAAAARPAAAPAAIAATPARASARRMRSPRMIAVGSARVRAAVRSGGIPSPAASANLAVAGGGRVGEGATGDARMAGIPSPAASERLGPQQLPFRATDGVTLPRAAGERDAHAVDSHYGNDTLAMEEPVELPAMTPGAAAARAEQRVIRNDLAGSATIPNTSGGLVTAM